MNKGVGGHQMVISNYSKQRKCRLKEISLCAALRGKNSGTTPCHKTRQSEFGDSYLSTETLLAFSIRAPAEGRRWLRSPLAPRRPDTQSNWMPFGRKKPVRSSTM